MSEVGVETRSSFDGFIDALKRDMRTFQGGLPMRFSCSLCTVNM